MRVEALCQLTRQDTTFLDVLPRQDGEWRLLEPAFARQALSAVLLRPRRRPPFAFVWPLPLARPRRVVRFVDGKMPLSWPSRAAAGSRFARLREPCRAPLPSWRRKEAGEDPLKRWPVGLVFDQHRGQRFTEGRPLDANHAHRLHGIQGLADRD